MLRSCDPVFHSDESAFRTRAVKCLLHSITSENSAMSTLNERLRRAREKAGYSRPGEAAAALGLSKNTYNQHENGIRGFKRDAAVQYARKFKVSLEWLLTGKGEASGKPREALLIGKVGAGAEIMRMEHPDVLAGIPIPDDLDAPNVAEIEGDSQYPLQPGWLIFYGPENEGVSDACLGRLCVVQVTNGPTLLKTVKKGSKKGLFRLESWNAPPREDVRLDWCAKVMMIRPR